MRQPNPVAYLHACPLDREALITRKIGTMGKDSAPHSHAYLFPTFDTPGDIDLREFPHVKPIPGIQEGSLVFARSSTYPGIMINV
jgi:hypothetical protein